MSGFRRQSTTLSRRMTTANYSNDDFLDDVTMAQETAAKSCLSRGLVRAFPMKWHGLCVASGACAASAVCLVFSAGLILISALVGCSQREREGRGETVSVC